MSTILIKPDKQSSKILAELAKRLGGNVIDMKDEQFEDFLLSNLMDKVKTGKTVSKESILKKAKNLMIVEFDKSFEKSLDKLKDKSMFQKLKR